MPQAPSTVACVHQPGLSAQPLHLKLNAQLLIATHAPGWADALPAVRHYLYPVHRSGAYMSPPSLAAALYLLILRWLSRDYEAAFTLCGSCAAPTPTPEAGPQTQTGCIC